MNESTALVIRSQNVAPVNNYRDYRDNLRADFWFSCAYCSMTEVEAQAIRFVIDHFLAKSKRPDLEKAYDNLMWCCDNCNTLKGDDWPDDVLTAAGFDLFRPDLHHAEDHFALEGQRVVDRTPTGRLTIELLDLNREQLRRLRDLRARMAMSKEGVMAGVRALLKVKIDQLPDGVRARFLQIRESFERDQRYTQATLEDMLEAWSRSMMIEVDDEAKARSRERRKYLRNLHALVPEDDK